MATLKKKMNKTFLLDNNIQLGYPRTYYVYKDGPTTENSTIVT